MVLRKQDFQPQLALLHPADDGGYNDCPHLLPPSRRIVIGSFWQYNVSRDTTFMYIASYTAGTLGCLFWTSWASVQEGGGTAHLTYQADILVHHNVGVPSGRSALREG